MLDFIAIIYSGAVIIISIPVVTFFIQTLVSILPNRKDSCHQTVTPTPLVTILIPAHNESVGLSNTLLSINEQITDNVKVLVVADNCNDDTAVIARRYGAQVIERFNDIKRGKGYALDFGIQHLSQSPPDMVLILDADCLLGKHAISTLVNDAIKYNRPIQGLYLMYSQPDAPLKTKIAEFAWVVKNWVRPSGFHRLGLPCQLMGSGMAFPWKVIKQVNLATGHIVEDMKLGVDLAKLNLPPRFCPAALITSQFPSSEDGIKTQRTRWEHGHIGMIIKEGPSLFFQGIKHKNIRMIALALDMGVPPLALLVLIIMTLNGIGLGFYLITEQLFPWILALIDVCLVGLAVTFAWLKFGRSIISLSVFLMVPIYMLLKIPLYVRFIFKRQSEWIRSKRDS